MTTKTPELKEVLHLYLGCPCEFFINMPGNLKAIGERMSIDVRVLHNVLSNIATCKPILRPLSDMTEEEREEYLSINTTNHNKEQCEANNTIWLISRHFDLFGLIESGKAIDKTTINQ